MNKKDDPLMQKIGQMFGLWDHKEGTLKIEYFVEWFSGTEEAADIALQRLKEKDYGENHSILQEKSINLKDVHECGTSSLMYHYFLEFANAWVQILDGVEDLVL